MAWEWVSLVVTGVLGTSGIAATAWTARQSARTQLQQLLLQQRHTSRLDRDHEVLRIATELLAAESEIVTFTLRRSADPSSLTSALPTLIEQTTLLRARASDLRLLVSDQAVLKSLDALRDALTPSVPSKYPVVPPDEAEAAAAAAVRAREELIASLRAYLDRPD